MNPARFSCCSSLMCLCLMFCPALRAQGVCDAGNGPMNPGQPSGIAPAEIIQKFAAQETTFKEARDRYGYTIDINVQTLNKYDEVDGEYQQTSEITLNDIGRRVEKATYAPLSTLRSVSLSQDDLDDIRQRLPASLTPEELRLVSVSYVGRQHVDRLDTYVFDVAAKNAKREKKLFQGRIWVDDQDFVIVKTCGKPHEDEGADSTKKYAMVDLSPVFVTYREQIDGKFWFTTYAHADELLRFPKNFVHVREVVKYSNYKPLTRRLENAGP